ncbi:hypothetical protein FACS189443_0370 [Planctomycetales bacterium]|nr:hypothetical protein FACS189443_0370 [Planctomycetales bacterium]
MQDYNIKNIDVLKIDVEGSEKEIFENSDEWIDFVNVFLIELHDRIKPGCAKAFFNAINRFNYVFLPEFTGDNLLVQIQK